MWISLSLVHDHSNSEQLWEKFKYYIWLNSLIFIWTSAQTSTLKGCVLCSVEVAGDGIGEHTSEYKVAAIFHCPTLRCQGPMFVVSCYKFHTTYVLRRLDLNPQNTMRFPNILIVSPCLCCACCGAWGMLHQKHILYTW